MFNFSTYNASVAVLCSLTCSLEDKEDDCKEPGAALIQCDIQIRASAYVVTAATSCQYLCDDSTCSSSLSNKASVNSPNIHFTGLFISPKVERDEVLIYNSSCNITMETEAEMECEGPNQPITAKITEIWKEWGQNTQSTFPLKFCGHWSKTIRWLHGHPPQDGDNVTVERGQTLILDTSTSILNLLPVKGLNKFLPVSLSSPFLPFLVYRVSLLEKHEREIRKCRKHWEGRKLCLFYSFALLTARSIILYMWYCSVLLLERQDTLQCKVVCAELIFLLFDIP
ncbi:fibrocystin-like isoform X2 [Rhineura floridana]|uniref:fibrocystin-like isoform X2 n=1 Tax=Rhineura floridana TaxID=261503 RepID=UPI002AC86E74|nr:fibrocystin-like isoform X2 [Rhineura floridana]